MSATRHRPLVLPAGSFLLGAALGPGAPGLGVLLASLLSAATFLLSARGSRASRLAVACSGAFVLGALLCWQAARVPADSIERRARCVDERPVLLRGRAHGLQRRTRSAGGAGVVVDLRVESLRAGRITLPVTGELRLFADAEVASELETAGLIEAWVRLRRSHRLRNFGLRPRPPGPSLARLTAPELLRVLDRERSAIDRMRAHAARAIDSAAGEGSRGLARALVLGVRDELEPELQRRLRQGGTAHVLAVSGLHVALVSWAAAGLARRLGARRRNEALVALLVAWSFAALAGFGLPVQRAAVLASCFCAGRLLGRGLDSWNALAAALIVTGLLRPSSLFTVGWWLTFGATAALLLLTRPLAACLPAPQRVSSARLRDALSASGAAWLGLVPVQLRCFGYINAGAPLLNLIAVPLAGVATAAALSGTLLAPLSVPLARPCFAIVEACAGALGQFDGSRAVMPGVCTIAAALTWSGALLAWVLLRDPRLRLAALVFLALAGASQLRPTALPWRPEQEARLTMLDVGQGSSTLVELRRPDGSVWSALIDGGGRPGSPHDVGDEVVVPALRALGLRRLDLVLLSHADYDHRGGLPAIVRAFRPARVLSAPVEPAARPRLLPLIRAAEESGAAFGFAARGTRFGPEGRLELLWPPRSPDLRATLGGNDASLVLRLRGEGGGLALIPGDVEAGGELGLLQGGHRLDVSLLLAPHHGSKTSSSPAFLEAVSARATLVSAGYRNRFGHPHPEVLGRLPRAFVTAESGALRAGFSSRLIVLEAAGSQGGGVLSLVRPSGACDHPPP